ncbi:acid protease [Suhomyces tanzawaensis NRRL Y-17324]|uniref:Acid protease n=1 Tax=Suhomyces tanzawaensis NRRL Y-17324 TaxID=984487 RepID=A0A1E4SQQ4_9ASCO|nr:acid protease [Suhomyces tanzawaensis NRRL Y-17324]ODV81825.1 acid protease [Suhomyces tanzawaensis NRRL Y-17324]
MKFAHLLLPVISFFELSKGQGTEASAHMKRMEQQRYSPRFNIVDSVPSNSPEFQLSDSLRMITGDTLFYLVLNVSDSSNNYTDSFNMRLDTSGVKLSWMYNKTCIEEASPHCLSYGFFNDSRPIQTESTFHFNNIDVQVGGDVVSLDKNDLSIGWGDTTISNFSMGFAQHNISKNFGSGVVALSSSLDSNTNLISQMFQEGYIDKEQFGLYLLTTTNRSPPDIQYTNSSSPWKSFYGGLIAYGSDAENVVYNITGSTDMFYVDINNHTTSKWLLDVTDINVSNGNHTMHAFDSKHLHIDTSVLNYFLPMEDAHLVHQLMFGENFMNNTSGDYAIPCNATGSLLFKLNDREFNFTADDLTYTRFYGFNEGYLGGNDLPSVPSGYCHSLLGGWSGDDFILGNGFLQHYYTIFDLKERRIGFGEINLSSFVLKDGSGPSHSSKSTGKPPSSASASSSSSSSSNSNATNSNGTKKNESGKINAGLLVPGVILGVMIAMA